MASEYPNDYDDIASNKQDDTDVVTGADAGETTNVGDHAAHHNLLADAVKAMQQELGLNPSGSSASVAERMSSLQDPLVTVTQLQAGGALTPQYYNWTQGQFGSVLAQEGDDDTPEQRVIGTYNKDGGTWKIIDYTSGDFVEVDYDVSAADLQTALNAAPLSLNVTVTDVTPPDDIAPYYVNLRTYFIAHNVNGPLPINMFFDMSGLTYTAQSAIYQIEVDGEVSDKLSIFFDKHPWMNIIINADDTASEVEAELANRGIDSQLVATGTPGSYTFTYLDTNWHDTPLVGIARVPFSAKHIQWDEQTLLRPSLVEPTVTGDLKVSSGSMGEYPSARIGLYTYDVNGLDADWMEIRVGDGLLNMYGSGPVNFDVMPTVNGNPIPTLPSISEGETYWRPPGETELAGISLGTFPGGFITLYADGSGNNAQMFSDNGDGRPGLLLNDGDTFRFITFEDNVLYFGAEGQPLKLRGYAAPDDDHDLVNRTYLLDTVMEGHQTGYGEHAASNISFTPAGGLEQTNVQAAVEELDTEKYPKTGGNITGDVAIQKTGGTSSLHFVDDLGYGASGMAIVETDENKMVTIGMDHPAGSFGTFLNTNGVNVQHTDYYGNTFDMTISNGIASLSTNSRFRDGVDPLHDNDLSRKAYVDTLVAAKQDAAQALTDISGLSPSNNDFMQRKAGAWTNRTVAQVVSDLVGGGLITSSSVSAGYQPLDQDLTDIAALAPSNDHFMQRKSGSWTNRTVAQVVTDLAAGGLLTSSAAASTYQTLLSIAQYSTPVRSLAGSGPPDTFQYYSPSTGTYTIVSRDGSGRFQAEDPSANKDVANKQWVAAQVAAVPAGPTGPAGKSVLYGTAAPTTEGNDGDFYIRTTTSMLYGPKASGVWPAGTSLIGAAGATGPAGVYVGSTPPADTSLLWIDTTESSDGLDVLENRLSADVSLTTSNTWYDGPSITLTPGTWMVTARLSVSRATTTLATYQARLTNKTTHYDSTEGSQPSQNPHAVPMPLQAIITVASNTTVYAQAVTTAGNANSRIKAATISNGSGNNASVISAVRVG